MDGEALAVDAGAYDAVISRLGLIYLPDRGRALASIHRALRPGGGLRRSTIPPPTATSSSRCRSRSSAGAPACRPPAPGQPGPFSLAAEGAIEEAYRAAGFSGIEVQRVAAPLRLASAAECLRFEQEAFGALHQMLSGLDEDGRAAAWDEIESELEQFEGPGGFAGPCELIVAAGTR